MTDDDDDRFKFFRGCFIALGFTLAAVVLAAAVTLGLWEAFR